MLNLIFCSFFWTVVFGLVLSKMISSMSEGINYLKKIHQIPCSNCAYFTGDYRLKCPLNPVTALTESAIDCGDFKASGSCGFDNWQSTKKKTLSKF